MIEADVVRIAAKLTKGERAILTSTIKDEHRPYHELPALPRACLCRKGALEWAEDGYRLRLTPIGLALKAHLANHSPNTGNMVPVDGGEG